MKRKIITTADGSKTIQIEEWNEQYHSKHGAVQEANHVYLEHGLLFFISEFHRDSMQPISVLEIGFGTGLNASLTLQKANTLKCNVDYIGVEAYPVKPEELNVLDYPKYIDLDPKLFQQLHSTNWETQYKISDYFKLTKLQKFFKELTFENEFDVIYYDAFGARVQPELWTADMFKIMYKALKPNGVLTTYAAIGEVRRTLSALGFEVERLQGPPGKRHMLRAIKR
ncbi:tRNA (5-methylaminomethyl-2-thiouridine)(34)-methyltransferase MnmD [Psychroserpens sp.]|uniref:tRNA (5-methylaminomethyl-2-thiouridine)(34)-methyltransferase MnmD n=1 Tax=Psychroserpens sp. TaxID=2020870 RepID=UPI001B1B70FB|nr:tRNA (5-methylaminomethyl-2-thiouridine)(34)-methyltransferase MnmD [Psychroserpens sp.]MBO6607600.1 tRNA (5-methylaminomethyl-2-thiouridine)(34)-methyltransferase MnmD [Psychroserpens sp.]MBO6631574.1 tRNA (5-methylaminomethyl-2-thiouridine)(34)-methyltransferase MnmD [Psychroserpens sp.]MBO6655088.1 tRNA (5-methylaminomethyl-2-thiouridine)(34)-methyltransferase MnmD [Psychroserpens sp.]MBO6683107.1 tRNA (5-methylaminomethyl-2-thiouridine)(34)-methyltransferase MnmD [Psychroserpens sp.]MBO